MKPLQLTFGIAEVLAGAYIGVVSVMLVKTGFVDNDNPNDTVSDICQKYITACCGAAVAGAVLGCGINDIIGGINTK